MNTVRHLGIRFLVFFSCSLKNGCRMRWFFLLFILLSAVLSLRAANPSVEEILSRGVAGKNFSTTGNRWEIVCKAWNDMRPDTSGQKRPAFLHFNGAFAAFAESQKLDSLYSPDSALCASLNLFLKTSDPRFLEMAGDLLLNYPGRNDLGYLAAMAYLRASEFTQSAAVRIAWERKAIFAMEHPIQGPAYYDKIRWHKFRMAYGKSRKAGDIEITQALTANPDFWPQEKSPFSQFAEEEMGIDRGEDRKLVPSKEITLPGVDPKEVKRNVRYNLYAIFVLLALFGTIGYMIWKFRQESKRLDSEDEKRA